MEGEPTNQQAPERAKTSRYRKGSRTAVACRRCKTRKQKCNGLHPCSNCSNSKSRCEYDLIPTLHRNQEQYLRARQRVEELEGILRKLNGSHDVPDTQLSSEGYISPTIPQAHRPEDAPSIGSERRVSSGTGTTSSPDEFVDVLRHLSFQASGGYVGSSSAITLGRMLHVIVDGKGHPVDGTQGSLLEQNLSPKSLDVATQPATPSGIALSGIPDVIADRMLEKGYFGHIATLWPLMRPSYLRGIHGKRMSLEDPFEVAALHLVYAAAGRFLETTGETGSFKSEQHYFSASKYVDELLELHNIKSVQILLLLAIYSLRAPRGSGAWSFVGLAMRLCIELGLHRKARHSLEFSPEEEELRRRVFWSCYCLDRQISIILGRPFAISDRDIDADLPTGADDDNSSLDPIRGTSSLACFVHLCRLRVIESQIQQSVYRVDQADVSSLDITHFLSLLEQWKANIPADAQSAAPTTENSSDYYMVYYYQTLRFLLHPHVSSSKPEDKFMQTAVEACGGICQAYKRLHQNVTVGFSLMALHSVFFAGLTLLYCVWKSPALILNISTSNLINDCSIVLYIITERWPGAKRYRDLFEEIKEPVLQTVEQNRHAPQRAVTDLRPELHSALRSMHPTARGHDDFSAMLMEMSGGFGDSNHSPQQYEGLNLSPDPSFMPGLAFDFSLPMDSTVDQFNGNVNDWLPVPNATPEQWLRQQA